MNSKDFRDNSKSIERTTFLSKQTQDLTLKIRNKTIKVITSKNQSITNQDNKQMASRIVHKNSHDFTITSQNSRTQLHSSKDNLFDCNDNMILESNKSQNYDKNNTTND